MCSHMTDAWCNWDKQNDTSANYPATTEATEQCWQLQTTVFYAVESSVCSMSDSSRHSQVCLNSSSVGASCQQLQRHKNTKTSSKLISHQIRYRMWTSVTEVKTAVQRMQNIGWDSCRTQVPWEKNPKIFCTCLYLKNIVLFFWWSKGKAQTLTYNRFINTSYATVMVLCTDVLCYSRLKKMNITVLQPFCIAFSC